VDGFADEAIHERFTGALRGHVTGASDNPTRFTGRLSGDVAELGQLTGALEGRLDPNTRKARGAVVDGSRVRQGQYPDVLARRRHAASESNG
jgi:hypothetical protein